MTFTERSVIFSLAIFFELHNNTTITIALVIVLCFEQTLSRYLVFLEERVTTA